jgi:PPK2 family polyphosphate:nucleotide phosphotransferase
MDYRSLCRVGKKSKKPLAEIAPAYTAEGMSHIKAAAHTQALIEKMIHQQYLLYADGDRSVLIVLQALDAAGKDGTISHIFSGMNPQGVNVASFKKPTPEESAHDFLWRVHHHAPAKGEVMIFNRSHYEDVLVGRVHKTLSKKQWQKHCDMINHFEQSLSDNGTVIMKFYLHISEQEQLRRFKQRLDDPSRHWKISESDYAEREFWPAYIKAYNQVISATHKEHAPWYIIPADHKWFRNLAISDIIARTIEELKLSLPPTRVDLEVIKKKYAQAAAALKRSEAPNKTRAARTKN